MDDYQLGTHTGWIVMMKIQMNTSLTGKTFYFFEDHSICFLRVLFSSKVSEGRNI